MMIMRRRQGETIVIADKIEIHITQIGRRRVKIAIDAPREVTVVAKEWKTAQQQNREAAQLHGVEKISTLVAALRAGN